MIDREDRNGVRILRLNHGKVSAIDVELGKALVSELKAAADPAVRAVVVIGTGSAFSAGVDLDMGKGADKLDASFEKF